MNKLTFDWKAIRTINGSQQKGFEKLCSQLADSEKPSDSKFISNGDPDAGVECYVILPDGSEWGWQAKYFDTLGDSQCQQIDKSIKTALLKHPQLVRYYVCMPIALPDARVAGTKSARQKWNEHVIDWTNLAAKQGMTVEFILWDDHEFTKRLTCGEHVGLVRFFFNERRFSEDWFNDRLQEAIISAGPRYTPAIHVNLPIVDAFEAFGRTEKFFNQLKAHAQTIQEPLTSLVSFKYNLIDPSLDILFAHLSSCAQDIILGLRNIQIQPTGQLPFQQIIKQIEDTNVILAEVRSALRQQEQKPNLVDSNVTSKLGLPPGTNLFKECQYYLTRLSTELVQTHRALIRADEVAGRSLLILTGDASSGKTHLLCDIAKNRIANGQLTVLLMGQKYTSDEDPWCQTLNQLHLTELSPEEFVSTLSAAAQAAGCRVLLIIDALNEGKGRNIWPPNLASFLRCIEKSPWIAVLLSVRSSYQETILPPGLLASAVSINHSGFENYEYEAVQTFFAYYGLELPSTPLLTPEFQNPLFLKLLCEGLQKRKQFRLPRGLQGITNIFKFCLDGVNDELSKKLDFNPKLNLINKALNAFVNELLGSNKRWLSLGQAITAIDACLPGRTKYKDTLYWGLVSEGVLLEERVHSSEQIQEEFVCIAYERLADHLIAQRLLDLHVNVQAPESAFKQGSALSFLYHESHDVSYGLLEALCIQIPERIGQELHSLVPKDIELTHINNAFLKSLIWRDSSAFFDNTYEILETIFQAQDDPSEIFDIFLTLSTLPKHPLNALWLNKILKNMKMPQRDSIWSTSLHRSFAEKSAVNRIIDWAYSLSINNRAEDETINLCAIALSWMLSSSNRFLRDRATTALVNLLDGRLSAVTSLVERFANIDDLYIAERIYAVAYGVAMRSRNIADLSTLATCVYGHVFANGTPPAHILLRDYARGVIERTIYLGAKIDITEEYIRPPYKSLWPNIPTEDEIKSLILSWKSNSSDNQYEEWARNRIALSVYSDDFARYIIGINSFSTSSCWSSKKLDKPAWKSTNQSQELLKELVSEFSEKEKKAYKDFNIIDAKIEAALRYRYFGGWSDYRIKSRSKVKEKPTPKPKLSKEQRISKKVDDLNNERDYQFNNLCKKLTTEHAQRLQDLYIIQETKEATSPFSGFDLNQIQSYILWRVFDLGWTTELFGTFDYFDIGHNGRESSKAERIGKKYQWIAYHEIMALLSDHFQHYIGNDFGKQAYEGPWQDGFRDIDPSCTLRAFPQKSFGVEDIQSSWSLVKYEAWGKPEDSRQWVEFYDDLPDIQPLLMMSNSQSISRCINLQGFFSWKPKLDIEQTFKKVDRQELWYGINAYLISKKDASTFLKNSEMIKSWEQFMPETPVEYRLFLGEYGWAPAYLTHQLLYVDNDGWIQPEKGNLPKVQLTAFNYLRESHGFDCSVDDSYELQLPSSYLINKLRLTWNGKDANYLDPDGKLTSFNLKFDEGRGSAFLFREDLLLNFLDHEGLTICWTVLGEKIVIGSDLLAPNKAWLKISGSYVLSRGKLAGFLKCTLDDPANVMQRTKLLKIIRTPPQK